jgi:hypothetical protein
MAPVQAGRLFRIDMKGTYSYIGPSSISSVVGERHDDAVIDHYISGGSEPMLFRDTGRLMPYLARTLMAHCDNIITIVIPGLRYTYFNNLDLVTPDRHSLIGVLVKDPLPRFTSIFDIPALANLPIRNSAEEYQLTGIMNQLDVVHIRVQDFVTAVNQKRPIRFILPGTNLTVELNYSIDDFWDDQYQTTVGYLDLSQC